jgi:hypothetical protein
MPTRGGRIDGRALALLELHAVRSGRKGTRDRVSIVEAAPRLFTLHDHGTPQKHSRLQIVVSTAHTSENPSFGTSDGRFNVCASRNVDVGARNSLSC